MVTPFSTETVIGDLKRGGFREQVAPGAFSKTLQERDIVMLFNHDTNMPLGRSSVHSGAGSLTLEEDDKAGLMARCTPVLTSYGRDLMDLTRAGVVKGMSFGFEVVKDSWTDPEGNPSDSMRGTNRTIHEVRLHEVSAVTFPAYPTTTLSARDVISAARESRAAKATYADLDTCGECGSENEYGSFCSNCGKPMNPASSTGNFCTSCGQELDDSSRASHVCAIRGIEDTEAGSATSDDEGERADLALLAEQIRIEMESL
jgi:HK97 family phage prohead protease